MFVPASGVFHCGFGECRRDGFSLRFGGLSFRARGIPFCHPVSILRPTRPSCGHSATASRPSCARRICLASVSHPPRIRLASTSHLPRIYLAPIPHPSRMCKMDVLSRHSRVFDVLSWCMHVFDGLSPGCRIPGSGKWRRRRIFSQFKQYIRQPFSKARPCISARSVTNRPFRAGIQ